MSPDEMMVLRLASELSTADPVVIQLSAFDAWTVLAIVQFASRHPRLSPAQHELMLAFGRGLQTALADRVPFASDLLDDGWDPEKDVVEFHAGGSDEPGGER